MKYILYPFAFIFYLIQKIRKFLYSIKICKRYIPPITTINIGNLSFGGNGKTPHTIYTARLLLNNNYKVSILLRGYKRKTRGFIEVNDDASVIDVGDEALVYKRNFGSLVRVAVCENRAKGIRILLDKYPDLDIILLDDAMQHWRVNSHLQLLLTDFSNPFFRDHLFPVGQLREPRRSSKRADIIIITKFPSIFSPIIFKNLTEKIKLYPHQQLFVSYISYNKLKLVFNNNKNIEIYDTKPYAIFVFTAIANPQSLNEHLLLMCKDLIRFNFPDHHQFTEKDVIKLKKAFNDYPSANKIIVTTEKDIPRLELPSIKKYLLDLPIYYAPIDIRFHNMANNEYNYDKYILDYVRKNQKNNRIFKE
ncbi:MAG: tetraacyldisaccharide 4'-kinase [Bacteroidales bacterium]|jgi:tetraacyldisaccharide 4'-kinase|nr:tetraacyldisaccharide 4'-kinase [Bacteroidales bacterium]MDD3756240.1 tetraacyldisaccharide 4'-kinase [Bacteroidales bacterium]MDI9576184.1 tetraacyldisaccharide 4'-kinase [Bacteroidota bacterium]MDY0401341.1 tetraacyldisaccharide 4'-kinase [Bacteroidales bacterium]HHW59564.1 tetraacyldisaccharide 4'-kinase [Bacteroidales bacterium]